MKRPLQIVELWQPRCSLRFGTAPCPATIRPKCYNTWATCSNDATRAVFSNTGAYTWRFVANGPGLIDDYLQGTSTTNNRATNPIPVGGLSISTSKSQINVGGILEGKSPFGVHSTCSVTMDDFSWADQYFSDFYLSSRSNLPNRTFWTTFLARNGFLGAMELRIYDGYEGDALAAMQRRLYMLESIEGPTNGTVTLKGVSPLMQADSKRSLFPPAYPMTLNAAITAAATSLTIAASDVTYLSNIIGLTTAKHIVIGSEIIGYTGYTAAGTGLYTLTGVTRAMGGTVAAAASVGAAVGRCGHFDNALLADAAQYLIGTWTPTGTAKIDTAAWNAERDAYLTTSRATVFIPAPTAVGALMGEICQQGPFSVWWDEYAGLVKMQSIRPPDYTPVALNDTSNIIANSARLDMAPESRLTRVLVYFGQKNATASGRANFSNVNGVVNADGELPQAGGEPRTLEIFGRWIGTSAQAFQVHSRIMSRYSVIPRKLSFQVSGKDRDISLGDFVDVTTRVSIDSEGRSKAERWQVVSWSEVQQGQTYQLDCQALNLDVTGRYAWVMANGTPAYTAASTAQKAQGCFLAGPTGTMSDGSAGYRLF